jgi:predicted nucleotidyltransferase
VVTQELREIILQFVATLSAHGIHVDKAVVYGSHSTNRERSDSDVDVAVISPDFGHDRFAEGTLLLRMAWRIDPRLHPVPLSSESFEKDLWAPLVHEIRETGIEIH